MSEDLQRLSWPQLMAHMRDLSSYWLLAFDQPGSLAWKTRSPEIESVLETNARIGEAAFEISRRVVGYESGVLTHLHGDSDSFDSAA